ncbi:phage terminase small subunit-related protein [Paenibacillus polymyxa]|nr:phage terminase small subunit-related protein [Paenibacillus polymyxa]
MGRKRDPERDEAFDLYKVPVTYVLQK